MHGKAEPRRQVALLAAIAIRIAALYEAEYQPWLAHALACALPREPAMECAMEPS
jgi:hypothetical protein